VFAEARVDPDLSTGRVPRLTGADDVGRVVSPKLARIQCIGGMLGGLGMGLLEQAEWDPCFGRVRNGNLAEYLVPVNADVTELAVLFGPATTSTPIHLASNGWPKLRCAASPRRSPMRSTMPWGNASVKCRSHSKRCWPDGDMPTLLLHRERSINLHGRPRSYIRSLFERCPAQTLASWGLRASGRGYWRELPTLGMEAL
jgi:hypothetical protein